MITAILSAIAAIPALLGYVEKFCAQIMTWYIQRQTNETLGLISDAAALASRAQTDEERYAAAQKWHDALNRPRVS